MNLMLLAQIPLQAPKGAPAAPEIKDIAPPVYVFPYPYWVVALAVIAALAILIGAVWLIRNWIKNRPLPPPPTPKEIALRALQQARPHIETQAPYEFSIRVSDILRAYISAQFSLPATKQTSQEFLASLGKFARFSESEKALLAAFLDKCDMVKFARIEANAADNEALVQEAVRFVEGAQS